MKQVFVLILCCLGLTATAAPTSTLGNLNAVAATAICQSSTQIPIYGFDILVSGTGANPNLTGFTFTTTGTDVAADMVKFQLWYSTTNSFGTATQISSDITSGLGNAAHPFAAFSQTMAIGSTNYFWITVDASAIAVYSHTVKVSALAAANLTVSAGTAAGTSPAGANGTFSTPVVAIAPVSVTRCSAAAGNTLTASGASTYSWSPATALSATNIAAPVTTATTTTTYTVTGTVSGCSSTASVPVTVTATPTVTVSPSALSRCVGDPASTLTASGATTYTWSPATNLSATTGAAPTTNTAATRTYTVTGTTGTCSATQSVVVTVNAIPAVTIAPAVVNRCAADAGNVLTASGATTYTWSPATGLSATTGAAPSTTATTTTTYTVTGTTSGCSSTASRLVTVTANPAVAVSNAGPLCSAAITASGATTYTWSPATGLSATTGATLTPAPSSNTTYTITGTAAGCTGTATTTIYAVPSVSITSGTVCATGTITASGIVTGGTIVSYGWAPATGLSATTGASVVATNASPVTYTVTATSNNACTISTTTIAGSPAVTSTPSYAASCVGGARSFTASGAATYAWSPATYLAAATGASVTATPTVAGTTVYTVTGTDARGCTATSNDTSYAGPIAPMPWTEGFEGLAANTVPCNESFGPSLGAASGQEGSGTAANVAAASGTAPGYGSSPVTIPAHTGTGLAGFGFHASSDYYFTPGFTLTAGNTYQFSFWYRIDGGATYTDDYNAYMVYNTAQSMTGATQFSTFTTPVVPGTNAALTVNNLTAMTNATYQKWTGYFTPATSTTYYFGINGQNNNLTNTYYWTFDDVAVNVASNCISPAAATSVTCSPATGTATNIVATATADSFICIAMPGASGAPSVSPVNGTHYAVGASFGGGTVIAKGPASAATNASTGYLAPGTTYNFYVFTYQHDTCNGIAYSTTSTTTSSSPSFTTCANPAPNTPTIDAMTPGVAGTASIRLTDLPTTGTVIVHAYTDAAATIAASPASYPVAAGDSTLTISNSSVYTGANLWFTVDQTIAGCTVTSSVSDQASVPCSLPWNQNFETGSSLNQQSPNYMQGHVGVYTNQTGAMFGAEDNHGATYVTAHGGSWDYLFFGGVTTSTAAPGTGAPYIPLAVYANQWLVTPGLYCATPGTYKLSFWYNNPSGSFPSIKLQYSDIPTIPATTSSSMTSATNIATVTPTLGGGWHQYTTSVTIGSSQETIFIGFDVAALSTSGYMAIDDIEFCQVPAISVTNSSSAAAVCISGTLSLTATPNPGASVTSGTWNYTWSGPGTIASTVGSGVANVTGLSTVGMNPTYSVSIINSQDLASLCATTAATTIATITPTPTAVAGVTSICGGATSLFTGGASYGTPGWSITGTGATYASGTVLAGYSVATTNPAAQQTVTINYSNACGTSTPKTININVQPLAITAADHVSVPSGSLCTSSSTTLTDNTTGGTWSNTPTTYGTINSVSGVFTSTLLTGTSTVSYTMTTGGCAVTVPITVGNTGPSAISGGAASVCVGASTPAFTSLPAGGTWSISPTSAATITSGAVVTGITNTNGTPATITYSTGCGTPRTTTINVNGTIGSLTAPATVCSGGSLNLSNTGVVPTTGTTYAWSGPNTFTSTAGSPLVSAAATMAANGTYTLTATNNSCANTYSVVATVAPTPAVPVITPGASSLCSGNATSLGAALTAQSAQVFAIPPYTPSFAVTNTLNSATTWTSGTSNDGYYTASLPFSFNFYGNTYNTVYIGTNGYVTFGAGSTLAPATAITAGTPGNVIALFQNDMTLASAGAIQYGITGTAPNRKFVVYYNAVPGTTGGPNTGYIVLNESTNVIDVIAKAFTRNTGANATCGISSTAGANSVAATGRNNAAYNVATPEAWRFYSLNNYNYSWTPAATLTSSTGSAVTTNALSATTTYTLTVADDISASCTSSANSTITVYNSATASLTNPQACIGAPSVNMPYTAVTGSPTTYDITWASAALTANFTDVAGATFPGGTSGNIPVSIGSLATPGSTYHGTITLNNAGACPTSYPFTVTIKAQPSLNVATVSVNPSLSTMCIGQVINLGVTGATGGASPFVYTWQGPGISGTPTTATGALTYTTSVASSGAYSVSLSSASTGCNTTPFKATTGTYTVLSSPIPTVASVTPSSSSICAGSALTLSAGAATGGTQYNWSGPAGYTATTTTTTVSLTPTTTAASGAYSVSITNTVTTCTSVASASAGVTVNPLADPGTITGTSILCVGQSVTLIDTTSGGTWTSSNPAKATVSGGVVTAVASGTATISYAVTNSCGTMYATKVITINPVSVASPISGNATICTGSSISLSDTATGGTWSSSNTAIATVDASGIVTPVTAGSVTISYTSGCGSIATKSETVITMPTAITGTSNLCSGATSTLTESVSGGTWSSSNTSVVTVSGTGVITGIGAGTATISYNNSGCMVTRSSAIQAIPAVITGTTNLCQGSASTLANAVSGGAWSSSNTAVATVGAATGIVSTIAAGSVTITYSNGCGTAPTAAVTVSAAPAAITGASSICISNTLSLSDTVPSGAWSSSNTAVATVDASGLVTAVGEGTATISYSLTNACGTNVVTQAVPVHIVGKWLGVNTTWGDPANWPCGVLPGATVNVIIPAGTPYLPNLTGLNPSVKNLTIDSNVLIATDSTVTLNIKGDLTVNGTIAGNGYTTLNGSAAQTIYGKGTVYNLTLNNTSGASVHSGDSLKIKGNLTLTTGTLVSNGGIVLAADSVKEGRLAPLGAGTAITGDVTVQQYILGGRRAFRFFGHPFSNTIGMSQVERNIDVTGQGGSAHGFTTTITNAASSFWYHTNIGNSALGYDPGWVPFTSADTTVDTNKFKRYEGIRLFVRGKKSEGLDGNSYTPSGTIISMSGNLNTGNQTMTLHAGTHSNYNQVSNPYASPTDIGTAIAAAKLAGQVTGAAFYVWNPYLGYTGAFEAKPIGSAYVIGQNTSFQVRAVAEGSILSFTESNKANTSAETLLRAAAQYLSLQVVDANSHPYDLLNISFDSTATTDEDKSLDAGKAVNPDLNFYSLSSDNKKLCIDARPFTEGSVIPLGFTTAYAQEYTIRVNNMVVPENGSIYLHDKYLQKFTMLEQGAEYKFNITSDAASQGDKRFELTSAAKTANDNTATKFNVSLAPNPATDAVAVTFTSRKIANASIRIMDVSGVNVMTKDLGAQQSGKVTLQIGNLPAGMYMVEVTSGDDRNVQRLIKE